jgi:catechol 2,3-dioxygenase-like lactoylglutathione lyase family enzyme
MIAKKLAYAALVVTDVAATATALAHDFGLHRMDCAVGAGTAPVFAVGASALALFAPADPFVGGQAKPGVHHIALEVEDLEEAVRRATAVGVPAATAEPSAGLQGTRRWLLAPAATCGVRAYLSEPLGFGGTRAGWVERMDHLGVASADNAAIVDAFVTRLGCPLESTQTDMEVQIAVESFTSDKYGVVYHTRSPEAVGGLRVAFVTVGDCELECLQEFDPRQGTRVAHDRSGTTKQDQGAIARFVASRGPGLHHIALKVTDINAALSSLERAGHVLIDTVGRPGSRRARIGFLHPKSLHGVLMHLVQR